MNSLNVVFLLSLAFSAVSSEGHASTFPECVAIRQQSVDVSVDGQTARLAPGERIRCWTLVAVVDITNGRSLAAFEDFSTFKGNMVLVDEHDHRTVFEKSLEPTFADPKTLYRGHTLKEVIECDHDLLGGELLAQSGDPSFEDVASCFAPITKMGVTTFVGTPGNSDKMGVFYGGQTPSFDPAAYLPAIRTIRDQGKVLDGLIGGWLPVLRFVYPEKEGTWTELVLFAPLRTVNGNSRVQPVWYRLCRIEDNQLKWAKYFDSYHPAPPRNSSPSPDQFYEDLVVLRDDYENLLSSGMQIDLPDRMLANLVRHSLIRATITRIGSFPKYGVFERSYGSAEHDGFQDTFNVDTTAMQEWGQFRLARDYIDNYFTHFVRDDASILYRGPETGQYGRMLTVLAENYNYTGDSTLLLKHRTRIDAVAKLLLSLRRESQHLSRENPAYGMLSGWCEADSCLDPDPSRYLLPYLSNSSEAVRGLGDLGGAWERIGRNEHRGDLTAWGTSLREESKSLSADLHTAIQRSVLADTKPPCLPVIAGVKEPFDIAVSRDAHDPQLRAYRAYMEMMYSGCLTREQVETIVRYRNARRDILLGVPAAYCDKKGQMAGFLSYGHAYGLLQYDSVREFLLELYSLAAHQYTRGTWTAPETRSIDPLESVAPYCVPAQLSVPLLVRWMLAFEEPNSNTLWLCKATPRDWLKDGSTVAATAVPTRWGKLNFSIHSHLKDKRIDMALELPAANVRLQTIIRLRTPGQMQISSVMLGDQVWSEFDAENETISLPASASGNLKVTVTYQ